MPTQTFFNLPEEKQERILKAAIDEFAQHSFQNVSIARIIEGAGIPRGSFYQYFVDLRDIYKYIFEIIGEQKVQYMYPLLANINEQSFFPLLKELYVSALRFANDHPKLAEIGNNFFKESIGFKREIMSSFENKSQDFFIDLLKMARERGEVGPGIDPEVVSFMFYNLNVALVDHFLEQTKQENFFDDLDGFLELVDKMLFIFENGMRNSL